MIAEAGLKTKNGLTATATGTEAIAELVALSMHCSSRVQIVFSGTNGETVLLYKSEDELAIVFDEEDQETERSISQDLSDFIEDMGKSPPRH